MLATLLRQLRLGAITVWIGFVIIFAGVDMLPGDACTALLEHEAKGELLENCRDDLGLSRPALARHADWAGNAGARALLDDPALQVRDLAIAYAAPGVFDRRLGRETAAIATVDGISSRCGGARRWASSANAGQARRPS